MCIYVVKRHSSIPTFNSKLSTRRDGIYSLLAAGFTGCVPCVGTAVAQSWSCACSLSSIATATVLEVGWNDYGFPLAALLALLLLFLFGGIALLVSNGST